MADNVERVQSLYGAFRRGDLATILDALSSDAEWVSNGDAATIPWGGVRKGRGGAESFFRELGGHVDFESFEPKEFLDAGSNVVVLGRTSARIRQTGRTFVSDWIHVFTFLDGRVIRFREYYDSEAIQRALTP